jgi:hypothetical protein
MDLTSILVQAAAGAIGGNATGAAAKNISLGPIGNTITGALGGGLAGPILGGLLGMGGGDMSAGLDFAAIAQGFATGGVSGALTAAVLGFIKAKFMGR